MDYFCINCEVIFKDVSIIVIIEDILNCCGILLDVSFREFRDFIIVMFYEKKLLLLCCLVLVEN